MNSRELLLPQIKADTYNWIARVIVAEKAHPRFSNITGTRYQSIMLMDTAKNTVRAMICDHNINAFQQHLLVEKTYLISKAVVKAALRDSSSIQVSCSGHLMAKQVSTTKTKITMICSFQHSIYATTQTSSHISTHQRKLILSEC